MENYYENIGLPLKVFLRERYKTLARACNVLRLKRSSLSMVIRGKRKPNIELLHRLDEIGFDIDVFDEIIKIPVNIDTDKIDDYKFIVAELKRIIRSKDLSLRAAQMELINTHNDLARVREELKYYKNIKPKIHSIVNSQ